MKKKKAIETRPPRSPAAKNGSNGHTPPGKYVGQPVRRREESRLVQGKGSFVDDKKFLGMAYMKLVRSPYAHARITRLDVSRAEAAPGVLCTLTGKEVVSLTKPFIQIGPGVGQTIEDYALPVDKVKFQGEPVAAVIAETRFAAEDAAELVEADYEILTPVLTAEDGLANASIIHEKAGTNVIYHDVFEFGDVEKAFKQAAYVVKIGRMHFHRFSSTPLENNAVIGAWDLKENRINFWSNNSFPAFAAQFLSPAHRRRMAWASVPADTLVAATEEGPGG